MICSKPFLSSCIQPRRDRQRSVPNLFYRPVYSPNETDRDLFQNFSIAMHTAQTRQTGICSKTFLSPCIQPKRDRDLFQTFFIALYTAQTRQTGIFTNLFYRPVYSPDETDSDLLQTFSIAL